MRRRVNDKRVDEVSGTRRRFASGILPAWARKSPQVAQVLPLLYLHGLSSGDFVPALEQFVGSAAGLSGSTVTGLTQQSTAPPLPVATYWFTAANAITMRWRNLPDPCTISTRYPDATGATAILDLTPAPDETTVRS